MRDNTRNSNQPRVTWFVPKTKWGALTGKPDWHPDMAQASVWIRGYQVAPYLNRLGYAVACNQIYPLPDIAVFLRRYTHADVELARRIKFAGGKIILDAVVNYFEARPINSYGYGGSSSEQVDCFMEMLSIADQVWTVSPFLQTLASQHHPAAHFISDSVDAKHFTYPNRTMWADKKPLVLGWSGIAAKAQSLEEISSFLKKYLTEKIIRILIISDRKPSLSFPVIFRKWHFSSFPKQIAGCNLCVAPRQVENDYERGHSIFKIGAFMAMGIPALAGPVPSYNLLLSDYLAGAICQTPEDWEFQLDRFISDASFRQSAGVHSIEKMLPFMTHVIAAQIDQLLKQIR